ncbi:MULTISPECIES: acyl-homoserine-lactone synthase [unclassified Iodidimonas]|jgi:acyl-homoserine lactone synthase|uniref:acyl-homoserine-lactone synthase n=1 Tax=unclassified Iodidimonas TaxID=2626145 RepID=UPI002482AAFC|nr:MULTISPECIES: acyl-homoserine-lactone synthase [unclassified Iodidimonas]
MVICIPPSQHAEFSALINQTLQHRKTVFIDELGWSIPAQGLIERDEFDDHATYFISVRNQRVLSSTRLLPTDQPHLMSEYFDDLCQGGAPRAPDILEISRMCVSPQMRSPARRSYEISKLVTACLEYSLLRDVRALSFVTSTGFIPSMLRVGLTLLPLGLPRPTETDIISAWQLQVSPHALDALSSHFKMTLPLMRMADQIRIAA